MAAPSVNLTIRDGGLGIVLPGTGNIHVKLGASPLGDLNTIIPVTNPTDGQVQLGKGGPLMEATAFALSVGGQGPVRPGGVYCVPVNPSTYGSASAVTKVGTGAGTVTVTTKPSAQVLIKCIAGGSSTTSTWQTSVDGGVTWSATWTAAATIILPRATFVTLAFGAGTAVTGDVVTIPTSGNPSLTSGTGTLIPTNSAASPVDAYSVVVAITTAGALGVAMFTYSLDGGTTVSAPFLVPGGGVFVLPDTGVVLTFASTFVAGDTYSFTTTGASYSSTDLTNAWTALVGDSRQWFMAHVVGAAASIGAAATLAASLEVLATTASSNFRFVRVLMEVPSDTDANTLSAFAASVTPHVSWCAGFHVVNSSLSGRDYSRNSAWSVAARIACIPPAEDAGRVQTGALLGVISIGRDEFKTPGLDNGRFTTLTSILGLPGFFVTSWRLGATPGSDFSLGQYGRVIDLVAAAYRTGLLKYLNDSLRVKSDGTGQIVEKDAVRIETYIEDFVRNSLPGNTISSITVTVDRTNNLLATQNLKSTCRVVPLGYAKTITGDLGFTSSSLTIQ
jgi:hypothetical protein